MVLNVIKVPFPPASKSAYAGIIACVITKCGFRNKDVPVRFEKLRDLSESIRRHARFFAHCDHVAEITEANADKLVVRNREFDETVKACILDGITRFNFIGFTKVLFERFVKSRKPLLCRCMIKIQRKFCTNWVIVEV